MYAASMAPRSGARTVTQEIFPSDVGPAWSGTLDYALGLEFGDSFCGEIQQVAVYLVIVLTELRTRSPNTAGC